jgi:hypothetical protein
MIIVETRRLEAELELAKMARPTLLKIDVQGGEFEVLSGISDYAAIDLIYIELSFVELYIGQPLFDDVYAFLRQRGFQLRGLFNASSTTAFGLTQVDALFGR